jgi:hypothetical protein
MATMGTGSISAKYWLVCLLHVSLDSGDIACTCHSLCCVPSPCSHCKLY